MVKLLLLLTVLKLVHLMDSAFTAGSMVMDPNSISLLQTLTLNPNSGGAANTGPVIIAGDLTVNGTTTTTNPTTVTIDDPIFTLGGDSGSSK